MNIEYYYEIWKSKKYTNASDWSNYDFDSMDIITAENATQAFEMLKEQIKAANELVKDSLYRYQARNLREI